VVLVSGCHIGDCHYIDANHWTEKRLQRMWKKMETLGLRKERLQLEWVSAAEATRWRDVMETMEELRKTVTAKEVAATQKALSVQHKKPARRSAKKKDTAAPAQSD
jgi:heterodisulfide reductase subunit A